MPGNWHRLDFQQEESLHNPRKDIPIQKQEEHRTSNKQDQKRKFPPHITVKTLSTQNKEC